MLCRNDRGQFVLVPVHQFKELEHHAGPANWRGVGPLRKSGQGGSHGGIYVLARAQADLARYGPGGGIEHHLRSLAVAFVRLAGNEMNDVCGVGVGRSHGHLLSVLAGFGMPAAFSMSGVYGRPVSTASHRTPNSLFRNFRYQHAIDMKYP